MKFTRIMSIVLISLTVIGWGAFIISPNGNAARLIEQHCVQAEEYINRGLYQLAITEYNEALLIDSKNEKVWAEKLSTYELLYAENSDSDVFDSFLEEADASVDLFPRNADFVLIDANLHLEDDDYKSAYKVLTKAVEAGVKEDRVLSLQFKVKYAFEFLYSEYSEVKCLVNNYFIVCNSDYWSYLDGEGAPINTVPISFAGPVGEDNIRFISDTNTGKNYLVDDETIIHGFFDEIPEDVGVYSDGLIAIKRDGKYYYYDKLGDVQFDGKSFDFAGTFNDETAAVMQDGSWFIIDKEGNKVSDDFYDDIILNSDFTYNKNNIQIFKYTNASKYSVLYKNKVVGEFDDVGVLADAHLIPVCIDSKWGYIDTKGNIIIEPQFVIARSFSNGLAAVSNGQKWGYIDADGNLAIDYQFLDAGYFSIEGCSLVLTDTGFDSETNEETSVWQLIELYNKIDLS